MDWFKIGKGVHQDCVLSSCWFNLHTAYIMPNAGLDEAQAGIKIARRNINNLRYIDDTTLKAESEEELKSLLMKVKEESEKAGLKKVGWKLNIQKTKIMASSSIISWQIEGEPMETVTSFIFLGSRITVDGDCSHEIKRCLFLGRKTMTNLDSILKSRDITLLTKVCLVKAMTFPVVMLDVRAGQYKEGWASKNWYFQTVVLEKTLESPLDCKEMIQVNPKGNQSWIFIGRTDAEDEAAILWSPDAKSWLIGKDPDAGKDWQQEEKGTTEDKVVWWHHQHNGHEFALSKLQRDREAWHAAVYGVAKSQTQLSD